MLFWPFKFLKKQSNVCSELLSQDIKDNIDTVFNFDLNLLFRLITLYDSDKR